MESKCVSKKKVVFFFFDLAVNYLLHALMLVIVAVHVYLMILILFWNIQLVLRGAIPRKRINQH